MDLAPSSAHSGLGPKCVVAVPADGEMLWRITTAREPALDDFLSFAALGDAHRGPAILTLGVSMYATQQQAEQILDRFPRGQHVVAIQLPAEPGIHIARTGKTPGHHTVVGDHSRGVARCQRRFTRSSMSNSPT